MSHASSTAHEPSLAGPGFARSACAQCGSHAVLCCTPASASAALVLTVTGAEAKPGASRLACTAEVCGTCGAVRFVVTDRGALAAACAAVRAHAAGAR